MKKIISVILLTLVLVSVFASCKKEPDEPTYKDTAAADAVMNYAKSSIASFATLSAIDDMYFEYMIKVNKSAVDSYDIRLQPNGMTLDEVGVLKAKAETVDTVKQNITDYLANRNADWTGLYLTEEYPKLRDAEVKVFGNYVVYAILSDSEKTEFFKAVEKVLTSE